ncbi:hypothetical protein CALVIDRAFT_537539 [Calocera viscosa TUFC12733]|uniref:Uncharacterized protein n=1 Tax=Calocera viscosa (strain TUFC12733) TaxID=1330018 RepID=A0A167LRE2_CALVF|nr:hypothetical protein CALVIDRAFT_537539 [Calocera viscosa TUFC12733]
MFARQLLVLSAAAVAVYGQLTITSPSSSIWWIESEQGNLAWTCNTAPSTEQTWTVMVANPSVTLLTDTQALIAEQPNYDCSVVFTPQLTPGSGYTILFVNPLNSTDVWATSQAFEVKPAGSTYAVTSSASGASGSGSSTPTAGGAAASQSSKAENVRAGTAGVVAAVMGGLWALL